ncbi:phosphoribosyltransferase [Flavisphingomonas formosensis]|uniref:phosphoribosyltransferase n=1 Tax=Flavisphingomonas formosensis TaxID=861534 RepID=UPI0012FA22E3|nr:phosphoribosyltransferase family protein [Sphingomonas formosensis]
MPTLFPISHDALVADIRILAERIAADGWRPDYLVGIGRGGLAPAAYLSHATGHPLLSIDHSTRLAAFGEKLLARIAAMSAAGKRMLLVDDINDSGGTIAHLRGAISAAGGDPANLRAAVLITNVRSDARADYWARSIDRAEDKRWFVFPWEAMAPRQTVIEDALDVPERLG